MSAWKSATGWTSVTKYSGSDDVAPGRLGLTNAREEFCHTPLQTFKKAADVAINCLGVIPERAMTAILIAPLLANLWLQRRQDFIGQMGRRDGVLAAGEDKHGTANASQ